MKTSLRCSWGGGGGGGNNPSVKKYSEAGRSFEVLFQHRVRVCDHAIMHEKAMNLEGRCSEL